MEDGQLLRKILAPHWWDLSPVEVKIYVTVFWFADPVTGELSLSFFSLSQKINMKATGILSHLQKLEQRGLIGFTAGNNPFLETHIKVSPNKVVDEPNNEDRVSYLPVEPEADNVSGNDKRSFKKNDKTDNGTVPENSDNHLTAESIATRLDDLKNLALYKAYISHYPYEIIEKAYQEVINTPSEKIKKSKGAYFTFLVKKYGSNL